ncbi:molybdenum cofactor sulfurase 3 [Onthophagus taurus]|uniref:molybdenum cofactor sulfurase 3 n=1 Tax=Onthophagus taurus TaxID=166361 RepID=UPI0039BE21E0
MNVFEEFNRVYSDEQEKLIDLEFKRCEGVCYLDHAGATLYGETQIGEILKDLKENLYGNPHSVNSTSKSTNDAIDIIRLKCLKHFNTTPDKYSIIFTSGATESLKIIGESFDYNEGSFVYLEDNHTSVLGMRDFAEKTKVILCDEADFLLNKSSRFTEENLMTQNNSLFVYPAQSNFNGKKYPLTWIKNIQNGVLNERNNRSNWFCMLDAAAFVSTSFLDLSLYEPDFVSVSFYKIFGYPTGLGALLVKNGSENVLGRRKFYGGGTVLMTMSTENVVFRRNIVHSKFEDGTLPFLSILSLKSGFKQLEKLNLNMDLISKHTFMLGKYAFFKLRGLKHPNGNNLVTFYHDDRCCFDDVVNQGGIINFNLLKSDGDVIGFAEVNYVSNLFGVQLRTGCFCNPGACQKNLKLTKSDVFYHFEQGHVCGDQKDLIDGTPTGSIRISFGYMSTKKDMDKFITMIQSFIDKTHKNLLNKHISSEKNDNSSYEGVLESIYLYPIKSCRSHSVSKSWPLIQHGLKYDREFMIADHRGVSLTQKNNTNLCKIQPILNLTEKTLRISYENDSSEGISLKNHQNLNKFDKCESKVCGDSIQLFDCGKEISNFLSDTLGIEELKLLQFQNNSNLKRGKELKNGQLSLVNEAQFLLINRKSVEWLLERIEKDHFNDTVEDLIERFRPNFVVDFKEPFVENHIEKIFIGKFIFSNVGNCRRCQMICINQKTGEKNVNVLRTLSKEFDGKISFGIYLKREDYNKESEIFINSKVVGLCKI